MSAKIATSDTGFAEKVREQRLLVDVLARMAQVLLEQRRNMPATPVEGEERDRFCSASRRTEAQAQERATR